MGYHLSGERASTERAELVEGDDGRFRFSDDAVRVILSTDRPVAEGFWERRAVSLRHTKAMLKRWKRDGVLNSDGTLLMLIGHGQRLPDTVGRWERLAVEDREGFKALVGSPAFDGAMMDGWAARNGMTEWRAQFENGTIRRASIRYEAKAEHVRALPDKVNGLPAFEAREWDGSEASWVTLGADTMAEVGRNGAIMDPEELKKMMADFAAQARDAAREVVREELAASRAEQPAPSTEPEPAPAPVAASTFDQGTWDSMRKLASVQVSAVDLLAMERKAIETETSERNRCQVFGELLAERMTTDGHKPGETPRTNARVTGGNKQSTLALRDFADIMRARSLSNYDQTNIADKTQAAADVASKADARWASATPRQMLLAFGRAHGILSPNYQYINDATLFRNMTAKPWGTHEQMFRHEGIAYMQVSDDVVTDRNGNIMVAESLQARSSGLVPGDVPALFLAAPRITFQDILDAERLPIEQLSVTQVHDNFEKHTSMRRDIGVPFLEVEGGGQRMPFAQVWGERYESEAIIRGFQFKLDFEAMMRDGGEQMMALATQLPSAWADRMSLFFVDTLLAGNFRRLLSDPSSSVYQGDYSNGNRAFRPLFQHVQDVTAKSDPVARPNNIDTNIARRVHVSPNLPDRMLVGYQLDGDIADYFAGKLPGGNRPGARNDESALYDYEMQMFRGQVRTQAIQDRRMVLFKSMGPHASVRRVVLPGLQNVWRVISASQNAAMGMGQLPTMDVEYIDGTDLQMNSKDSTFANTLPV